MDKNLFDNIAPRFDPAEEELKDYDTHSFIERVNRLKFINKIYPFGYREFGSDESSRIFDEALHSYIFGQYVATIILAQAFVERRFQEYFHIRLDEKRCKYTLAKFINEFKGTGFLPDFIIDKIDKIRLKRNPFVHHRIPLQKDTLMARSFERKINADELLQNDAKEAIEIMLEMVQRKIL